MKKFAKLLVVALSVAIIASLFAVSSSAAEIVDPNTLQPASDRVIFIKDAPRDENNQVVGKLEGDGTGSDADNPLQPIDHEQFSPDAQYPKWHLQTAFYQATELLKEDGGTIVVCGPVFFGVGESYGSGGSTRDVFTAKFGDKTIKITSVYNGVDYRETAGAKIILESPAEIGMYGQSIWENIDIATASTYRVISFSNYATLIGEGVKCYPTDEAFEGVAANYVSLSAGHRYSGGVDLTTNLVVKSGSYNVIAAGEWGVNASRTYKEADNPESGIKSTNNLDGNTVANLVIEGTTTVYGEINGTNRQGAEFSGQTNVTINGGKFECDINMVGKTGMVNTDGKVNLKINGGDFAGAWSINTATAGHTNNPPAVSVLDFSGWTGELSDLANAYGVVSEPFSEMKFPAGVTGDQVLAAATTATEAPAATDAPVATDAPAATDAPVATEAPATEAPATDAPAANETEAPDATTPDADDEGGSNMTIIIIAIVAVVVIAGVVVGIVLAKKKK